MENRIGLRSLLLVSLAVLVLATPSSAEKGGHGKGGGKGASHGQGKERGQGVGHGRPDNAGSKGKGPKKFESSERSSIQRYYQDEYSRSGNCPPGLAKKDNGCMPPGQAGRRWSVGNSLPSDIVIVPLPPALRATVAVPLPGYDYGYVDGEVILFGVSDRVVVDFVAVY